MMKLSITTPLFFLASFLVSHSLQLEELTYQGKAFKLENVHQAVKESSFIEWQVSGFTLGQLPDNDADSPEVRIPTSSPDSTLIFRRLHSRTSDYSEYELIWRNAALLPENQVCFFISTSPESRWFSLFLETPAAPWPMDKSNLESEKDEKDASKMPFISGKAFAPMLENILLNTGGFALIFDELVPWLVHSKLANLCFTLQPNALYPTSTEHPRVYRTMRFRILAAANIRQVHRALLQLGLIRAPSRQPESTFFGSPVWSYSTLNWTTDHKSNGLGVLELRNSLKNSFLVNVSPIVDLPEDSWQAVVGTFEFSESNYPKEFLHNYAPSYGLQLALSVGPKVNKSSIWITANNTHAKVIDFSNPSDKKTFFHQLVAANEYHGTHSFKFFPGTVADFTDNDQVLFTDEITRKYPNFISAQYAQTAVQLGDSSTYSTAFKSQTISLYFRLEISVDPKNPKASLKELLVKAFTLSLAGYQFFLAEPILREEPSEEWLLSWLQVTSLFPGLYLSYPYWTVKAPSSGPSTLTYVQALLTLRSNFAPEFNRLADDWITGGKPIFQPMFLAEPEDPEYYDLWNQFLLGEQILVVPMVDWSIRKQKIYFPPGRWSNPCKGDQRYTGPTQQEGYSLEKYSLLIFLRDDYEGVFRDTKRCNL